MSIDFYLCLVFMLTYATVCVLYARLIFVAKKTCKSRGKEIPRRAKSFLWILVLSFLLLVLPLFIPLRTSAVFASCACAVLSAHLIFKERLSQIKGGA